MAERPIDGQRRVTTRVTTRRSFLGRSVAGGALVFSLGELPIARVLGAVSAEDAKLPAAAVRLRPEIEPLVRLLEETPRERLLEEVAARIRRGLSYREVLAALLLAGVRNVQPRPQVGFKFHAVLVVNSAHLASLASPDADRWLPIFWALDYFKSAQAQDEREGDWTMAAVDDGKLPPAHRAREELVRALDGWDEEAADHAVAALARSGSLGEVYELLWRYGARDFRSIGHKAIFTASSWRTLQAIGHEHAEPVLRSLTYALLQHEGDNPAGRDADADRPWKRNRELARGIRPEWRGGTPDDAAAAGFLAALRDGSDADAARQAVELLNRGVAPSSLWDGILAAAAELVLRQPRILPLHAITTANALHYAFRTTAEDETRRLLLLQAASFLPLFREGAKGRGELPDRRIETLEPAPATPRGDGSQGKAGPAALEAVFARLREDREGAARELLAYLAGRGGAAAAREVIDAARVLIFLKGTDSHDYKFSSAILEDYYHLSPRWRDRYLAANLGLLRSSSEADNSLVRRVREALAAKA
jgi:hypothetical protein